MGKGSFGGSVKLTGESEYQKALGSITNNLKVLNSEMKTVTSQYDKNDKSTANLSQQNEILNKKIAEQEEKVRILKNALSTSKEETGKNSETTKKWQTELNNAQAELNKLNKDLTTNEQIMKQEEEAIRKGYKSFDEMAEAEKKAQKETLSLGDIIKANLISDAIKGGLSALASGISAVGSAMSESLSAGAEYADNILTLSTQTGVSTENLQKFNAVAELVDVSTETMTKSMAKNIKSMTSAQEGTGAMADAYKKLGVSVTNADGTLRDGETVYWETIDALKNVADETERDSIAMEILGKSAQELNPLIAQGSEGIKAMGDEAVKMGAVLSEDALNSLGAVDDEMQRMSTITGATSNLFASAFAPAVSTLMGGVNDLGGSFNYLLSSIIGGDEGGIAEASTMISEGVTAMVENIATQVPALMEVATSLIRTLVNVISENLPMLVEGGLSMVMSLLGGIGDNIHLVIYTITDVLSVLITTILENLPMILEMGMEILNFLLVGISENLPSIIPVMINSIVLMVETLLDNIDMLIETGIILLSCLAEGLIDALPDLLDKVPVIIEKLIQALTNNIPYLIEMGVILVVELAQGLIKAIPSLLKAIPQIISSIVNGFANFKSNMGDVGLNLVKGIWNGIKDATGWILDKIKGFGQSVLDGIKSVFGIHSPSRLFKDEVGKNLALGVGEGFADTMADVSAEMQGAIPTSFDADVNTNFNSGSYVASNYDMMLMAFKQALKEVKVVMNNREMGAFVEDTMERVVFA